jgi:hypothetical protein
MKWALSMGVCALACGGCVLPAEVVVHNELSDKSRFTVRYSVKQGLSTQWSEESVRLPVGASHLFRLDPEASSQIEFRQNDRLGAKTWRYSVSSLPNDLVATHGATVHVHFTNQGVRFGGATLADELRPVFPILGLLFGCGGITALMAYGLHRVMIRLEAA